MSKAIEENRDPGHEDRHWALKLLILVLNLVFLLASIAALLVAASDILLDNNTLIDWFETHLSALILLIAVTAFFRTTSG